MNASDIGGAAIEAALVELGLTKSEASRKGDVSRKTLQNIFEDKAKPTTRNGFIADLRRQGVDLALTETFQNVLIASHNVAARRIGTKVGSVSNDRSASLGDGLNGDWSNVEAALKALCKKLEPIVDNAVERPDEFAQLNLKMTTLDYYYDLLQRQIGALKAASSS